MNLGIYGASGLGREVLEIIKLLPDYSSQWKQIIFIDDIHSDRTIRGLEVVSFEQIKKRFAPSEIEFIIAVGEPFLREIFYKRLKENNYSLITLVHPTASIPESTILEEGVVIGAYSLISCDVAIHANTYIQNHVSIGHDTEIGPHSVLSAFDAISGCCQIGSCTYLAMSIPVKDRLCIGSGSIIGIGSVVSRNIPDGVIAMGNPARAMKKNEEQRVFK